LQPIVLFLTEECEFNIRSGTLDRISPLTHLNLFCFLRRRWLSAGEAVRRRRSCALIG